MSALQCAAMQQWAMGTAFAVCSVPRPFSQTSLTLATYLRLSRLQVALELAGSLPAGDLACLAPLATQTCLSLLSAPKLPALMGRLLAAAPPAAGAPLLAGIGAAMAEPWLDAAQQQALWEVASLVRRLGTERKLAVGWLEHLIR